jgi:hypothetical protein
MVIGALVSRGPSPDGDRLVPLLQAVDPALVIQTLAADRDAQPEPRSKPASR